MATICPSCSSAIAAENINVGTDVGFCRDCETTFKLSSLVGTGPTDASSDVDPYDPPKGAWYLEEGGTIKIGATTRSAGVLLLLPFTVVWSGGSMWGIYGSQISSGNYSLFLSLFGIPFLIGSVFLWGTVFLTFGGSVQVTLSGDEGNVFTGVGPIGWHRRLRLSDFSSIKDLTGGQGQGAIVLEGRRRMSFGIMLKPERRYFIAGVLKQLLANKPSAS